MKALYYVIHLIAINCITQAVDAQGSRSLILG